MQQQQQNQRISNTEGNNEESATRVESGNNIEETTAKGRTVYYLPIITDNNTRLQPILEQDK